MLRRPSFQEELFDFLRRYPVFFRFRTKLLRSYGSAEKEVTKEWKNFLEKYKARIEKVEESDEATYYKYVPRNARQAAELEHWEETIFQFESHLQGKIHEFHKGSLKGPVFERVPPYIDHIPGISGGHLNPEYRSLADCTEERFVPDEKQFSEKWNISPHHICPQKEPIFLLRDELLWADGKIQLFIPVAEMTTKEEIGTRWREVSSMQRALYGKKTRPNRKMYGTLIKIYDLWERYSKKMLAEKLGMSQSSIAKDYRRVHIDIYGVPPPRRSKKSARLLARRKTRLDILAIVATHGARGSEDATLRKIFIENKLPLNKLHTPEKLNCEEKEILRDALRSQNQQHHSKVSPRKSIVR